METISGFDNVESKWICRAMDSIIDNEEISLPAPSEKALKYITDILGKHIRECKKSIAERTYDKGGKYETKK